MSFRILIYFRSKLEKMLVHLVTNLKQLSCSPCLFVAFAWNSSRFRNNKLILRNSGNSLREELIFETARSAKTKICTIAIKD